MLKTRWFFMDYPVAKGAPPFGDLWSGRCRLETGGRGLTGSPVSPGLHLQLHPGLHRLLCLPADEPGAEGRAVDHGLGGLPGPLQCLPELAVGLLWLQHGQPHRDQWHPQVRRRPLPVLTVSAAAPLALSQCRFKLGCFCSHSPLWSRQLVGWTGRWRGSHFTEGEAMALGLQRSGLNVIHRQGVCPRSPEVTWSPVSRPVWGGRWRLQPLAQHPALSCVLGLRVLQRVVVSGLFPDTWRGWCVPASGAGGSGGPRRETWLP